MNLGRYLLQRARKVSPQDGCCFQPMLSLPEIGAYEYLCRTNDATPTRAWLKPVRSHEYLSQSGRKGGHGALSAIYSVHAKAPDSNGF